MSCSTLATMLRSARIPLAFFAASFVCYANALAIEEEVNAFLADNGFIYASVVENATARNLLLCHSLSY